MLSNSIFHITLSFLKLLRIQYLKQEILWRRRKGKRDCSITAQNIYCHTYVTVTKFSKEVKNLFLLLSSSPPSPWLFFFTPIASTFLFFPFLRCYGIHFFLSFLIGEGERERGRGKERHLQEFSTTHKASPWQMGPGTWTWVLAQGNMSMLSGELQPDPNDLYLKCHQITDNLWE